MALLCSWSRYTEAEALLPSTAAHTMPRAAAVAYRYGLLPMGDAPAVPLVLRCEVDYACGAWEAALVNAMAQTNAPGALVLQTAQQVERVLALLASPGGPTAAAQTFRHWATLLSWPVLRTNCLATAAALETGSLAAVAARATRWIAADLSESCKELRWKVTIARARMGGAKQLMGVAAQQCEAGQRWRVWLEGARMESGVKRRALVAKALKECPERHRATVLLEAAALADSAQVARAVLAKAWSETADWKVALEQCLWEMRQGRTGTEYLKACLANDPGAGRIWSTLCRLAVPRNLALEEAALRLVPKSGEMWTEIGRQCARQGDWSKSSDCFGECSLGR